MDASPRTPAVYRPRPARESPLYRLVEDHFETLLQVHEEEFRPDYEQLRHAAHHAVVEKSLDCGVLESDFARVRCARCRAGFLVAFQQQAALALSFLPRPHPQRQERRARARRPLPGRVGVGKSFLIDCFASECGPPALEMGEIRSKWVGDTERQQARVLMTIRALGPVIVIVDEADAVDSFIDPLDPELLALQELSAVLACSDRRYLPAHFATADRATLAEEFARLKLRAGRR